MNQQDPTQNYTCEIPLTGLDGSNPLAFLAALGTLRSLSLAWPDREIKMAWKQLEGAWRPVLHLDRETTREEIVISLKNLLKKSSDQGLIDKAKDHYKKYKKILKEIENKKKDIKANSTEKTEFEETYVKVISPLIKQANIERKEWLNSRAKAVPKPYLALGKTINCSQDEFKEFLKISYNDSSYSKRETLDFASSFGSEVCLNDKKDKIISTEFCFIFGSGHQYFLDTISKLMRHIDGEKIDRSLFSIWKYKDKKLSFRWNPIEDIRYAYKWENPSDSPVNTEHGANLLASMSLPFFPSFAKKNRLSTTCFTNVKGKIYFTWPIWVCKINEQTIKSLLSLPELQQEKLSKKTLESLGGHGVFRSQKIKVGTPPLFKYNFTPAKPI